MKLTVTPSCLVRFLMRSVTDWWSPVPFSEYCRITEAAHDETIWSLIVGFSSTSCRCSATSQPSLCSPLAKSRSIRPKGVSRTNCWYVIAIEHASRKWFKTRSIRIVRLKSFASTSSVKVLPKLAAPSKTFCLEVSSSVVAANVHWPIACGKRQPASAFGSRNAKHN